jgi:hypothetical protein
MKKLTFISSLLFVAFLSPVMADRKHSPFEWHGTATRIQPDSKLADKEGVSNHPSWIVKPLSPAYSRMVSPSAGGSAASEGTSFAKCVGNLLCPVNWFKKK